MIVSHKHKFIFLKTRKTAGTSIQIALSGICDIESDIITGSNIKDGIVDESNSAGWNMDKFITNHPHPPIQDVKNVVTEWNDYFKFANLKRAEPGFDPGTSRTLSGNHTTRPHDR